MRTPKRLQGVKKAAHSYAPKQEKKLAEKLGGKVVKGSGCGFDKGDVRIKGVVRIECKSTERNSFSVTDKIIRKIEDAATSAGELPFIQIDFITPQGKIKNSVVVCPLWVLNSINQGGKRDAT